ncbi:TRAP transporter small permease [Lacrimispora sp.]|uniref:TRAP transporter small permease n=1 Tax=Lacrimispora sp. TaxID=2719234 RepID=UPI00345FCCD5
MERLLEKLNKVEEYVASSLLIMTSLLVFVQVILRYFANYSISWSEEIALMMIVWFIFLGSSIAVREKAHVNMDALPNILPPKGKLLLEMVSLIISVVFCGLITMAGVNMVIGAYDIGSASTSLKIPLYIPYASVPVGLLLMMIRYLIQLKNLFVEAIDIFGKREAK